MQLLGDLRVGVAERDQPHHLALALGQRGPLLRVLPAGRHQRAQPRVQVVAAGHREAERLQQLGGLGLLEHVAARPRPQRLAGVLGVLAHRQDRDRQRRMGDEALRQRGEARAAGHRQIERQQVGLVGAHFADRRRHVGGLRDHDELLRLALQHGADPVAHDGVVVGDDHLDRAIHAWRASLHPHTVAAAKAAKGGALCHAQGHSRGSARRRS